ncbi:MAG: Kelch repeat-containing protein [Actinophytocola sp.]|uniref:Kelch repeat-containing protein n=1 Tax=Actinophytocola sp. TaxID=1872138 RepID=UPI003D6AFF98
MRHLLAAALLLTAAACASEPEPDGDGWRDKSSAPSARTEVAAGVLDAKIWVAGGLTEAGAATEVAIYDPAADSWAAGPDLPEPRHHTGAAGDGERLWVVGGYTDTHEPTDTVWTIEDGAWTDGPELPEPRAAGALAWDGQRLVYAGGVGPNGLAGDVFELRDDRWRRIGVLGTPREHLAAASDGDGTTWFLAGRKGGLDTNVTDVDVVTGDRVRKAGDVPTARGGVAGFHAPGRGGCVVGGEAPDGTFDQVECVDADGKVSTLPALDHRRHGLGAAVVDGVAYTLLGGPTPGLSVADVVEALPL